LSQNCDGPPNPCNLIIDRAKSKPNRSAISTTARLRSKLGLYCGEVVETSQPLLQMGRKTPTCITVSRLRLTRWRTFGRAKAGCRLRPEGVVADRSCQGNLRSLRITRR